MVEAFSAFQLQVFLEDGRGDGFGLSEVERCLCDRLMIKRYEVVINGGEVICVDPKHVIQNVRTIWSAKVKVSVIGVLAVVWARYWIDSRLRSSRV